jgi:hypothetical protein
MWPSKPHMNMLEHRVDALTREGPHDATGEEIAEVLITLAIRHLRSFTNEPKRVADKCHQLVELAMTSGQRTSAPNLAQHDAANVSLGTKLVPSRH